MHADIDEGFMLRGEIDVARDTVAYRGEPARDPRTDPQPGDVLAVDGDVREVLQVAHGSVEYGFPGKSATRWLHAIRWQVWARNAEVRKVAP